ncbi:hypothetical protein [Aquirufa nivalisilvae]|uniref:hypothetical protein n=1 Tax=Aquirufa nivalisilvae TaxID=2516557 RepID=UPI0022A93C47|nr:hypothetical protein [Aquirufa nivalisilvae]MCZ2479254.1 hypothetical protein [Aquirufa nivalisilvae]
MDKIEKIKRIIHYYYLEFEFNDKFIPEDGNHINGIFKSINQIVNDKNNLRYQEFGEKLIFIQELKFEPQDKKIVGKLRCVRKDILPEIMNIQTDIARGIEAKEEEGLVETTHFIIDNSSSKIKLAIEYNQFGAKIVDFVSYVKNIGINMNEIIDIKFIPVVNDDLSKFREKINRCSLFQVKVHKDNIKKIQEIDLGLYTALNSSIEHFKSEYASLTLKFDYKTRVSTSEISTSIFKIIDTLTKDKSKIELFDLLSVKAENSEKNNLLETFNLLVDKVSSELNVEKKKRYRTIVSADIFEKMKIELLRKNI